MEAAIDRFRVDFTVFWREHRLLFVIFTFSLILDALSTVHFMSYEGVGSELNPVVALMSITFGTVAGPFIGAVIKAFACVLVAVYYRPYAKYLLVTASLVYFWAAWYNVWGVNIYTPLFFYVIP